MSTQWFVPGRNAGEQLYVAPRKRRSHPVRVVIVEDSERILAHLAEELSTVDNVCIAGTAASSGNWSACRSMGIACQQREP